MSRHVALLRGINVGGKNKLPMADLRAIFDAIGCTDVRTYIQSGNVVFDADDDIAAGVADAVSTAIANRFGYQVPVVLRTAEALAAAVAANPYADVDLDDRFVSVGFLAAPPTAEGLAALEPERFLPDVFTVVGNEIFLCYPNGAARSKMTNAYFDRRLGTVSTMRNWRTTKKLLAMCGG